MVGVLGARGLVEAVEPESVEELGNAIDYGDKVFLVRK